MQDYNQIINNMNRKIFFKLNKVKIVPDEEGSEPKTVEEYMGTGGGFGFSQHYGGDHYGRNDRSSSLDVPNVASLDREYTTHRPHSIRPDHPVKKREQKKNEESGEEKPLIDLAPDDEDEIQVQEQDAEAAPAAPEPPPEEPMPEEMPEGGAEMEDPGMEAGGMDPGMGDPGMGDPMAGTPGEEEPKNPTELGRTYEMKKIYARLVSMNEYLADEMSPKILKAKRSIAKAIDLFAVIGANPDSYKERIDEIIISYYRFLEAAYKKVRAFYKSESKKVGGTPLENNLEQNDKNKTEVRI